MEAQQTTASFRRMGIGGQGQRVDDGAPQPSANIDGIDLTGSGGGGGGDGHHMPEELAAMV